MIDYWVIPPEHNAEFVACMEDVLEIYAQPYDSTHPVICMDEQPVQLIKETRAPIEATLEHPKRADYEYERNGTASIFLFSEPLAGYRQATARPQRTKADWANEVATLLDTRYADCNKVTLVKLEDVNRHHLITCLYFHHLLALLFLSVCLIACAASCWYSITKYQHTKTRYQQKYQQLN